MESAESLEPGASMEVGESLEDVEPTEPLEKDVQVKSEGVEEEHFETDEESIKEENEDPSYGSDNDSAAASDRESGSDSENDDDGDNNIKEEPLGQDDEDRRYPKSKSRSAAEYRKRNRERIKEKNRAYRRQNRELELQKKADYRRRNRERLNQKQAEYRRENKDQIKQKKAEYRKKLRELSAKDEDVDVVYYIYLEDNKEEKEHNVIRAPLPVGKLPSEIEREVSGKIEDKFKCLKCPKEYFVKKSLKDHLTEKHMYGDFQCKICDSLPVYFAGDLFEHHAQKHAQLQFDCPCCNARFSCEEGLLPFESHYNESHVARRTHFPKPSPRMCEICGQTMCSAFSLYQHMNSHLGIKPLKCDECDFATTYSNSLNDHKKTHLKEKGLYVEPRVFCEICGKSFARTSLMKEHVINIHEGLKSRHECKECGLKYTYISTLRKHFNKVHREKPSGSEEGKNVFRRNRRLPAKKEPGEEEKPKKKRKNKKYPCQYCNKVLPSKKKHEDHTRLHTDHEWAVYASSSND